MERGYHDPASDLWWMPKIDRRAAITRILLRRSILRDCFKPASFIHVDPTTLFRPGILMSVVFPGFVEYVSNGRPSK
jgi:hypothetical protein